ncbi:pre-mRNA-splicing factor ATP-dependent RNA helicase PRP43 [Verticillium alfalfae VaMs.102]|uniref:RNA helicase n=1 Tax=Verticillium alfalfae (strain VaMs.102 / ATCC MYA-4576 / FGSC 10136) TaxID=526221 RepID=C9SIA6_VERA1|nr:pre-mRNA-splicing factor ATP-dependent RNA helicase PRP43 [Verticillium alfalfae VaMs.102]EEY18679.1 pre-mRNA-splicing factor ATP-dependent RNA helicase PRP43 [Verticillium alfalfae VaMs.102]
MGDPKGGEPKSKKRKLNNQNVLKVGNKVISLEGYLNPPAKKPPPAARNQHPAVPQFLTAESWCRRKTVKVGHDGREAAVGGVVAITQPRRVAATTLAHRVAREAGTPLRPGAEGMVGYSVRFDHNVPKGTKIKFVTEGMLLQELLHDPHLRQYSAIVVDEIHERSVDVDLLSGFLKQILSGDVSGRGGIPLKVVIMSATADVERIQRFFSEAAPVLEGEEAPVPSASKAISVGEMRIPGRQFPVQTIHLPRAIPDIQDSLLKSIFRIHTEEPLPGDILAFLTGQEEIEAAQGLIEEYAATLASNLPKIRVFPLFGQLSIEAQHEAFKPIKGGFTRKVVLATNIAETSVTVPGVRYVVDCGKAKVKQYRSRLGMESLLAKPISKSSAIQRTGRAGREGPGKCYRLYPEDAFNSLEDTDLPEILRIDVLGAVLTMKARGIDDVLSFPLMDAPAIDSIEKALIHLHGLGALADDGSITSAGRKMAAFPVSAPLGTVLLAAAKPQFDCLLDVIDVIAALTSGDDIFMQLQSENERDEAEELRKELYRREGDILTYLTTMQLYAAENADRTLWCKKRRVNLRNMKTAMNIRRQLRALCLKENLLAEAPPPDPQPFVPLAPERAESLLKCFLRGFVSKTAVLAPDASYVTSQGKHVVAIHPASVLHGQKREAIMFLEHVYTQKNYAKKVSVIQANWIIEALQGEA